MPSTLLDRLNSDRFISQLQPKDLARLLSSVDRRCFAAGQVIFACGEPAEFLYLLESGHVSLQKPQGPAFSPMDARFGNEAAAGLSHYLCSARAEDDVSCVLVPKLALLGFKDANPGLALEAIRSLASDAEHEGLNPPKTRTAQTLAPLKKRELYGWLALLICPFVIYFLGIELDFPVEASMYLALLGIAILMWIFSLVDEFVPPLIVVAATLFVKLAPVDVALSGFSSSSLLTFLGVFALSATISASGLSYRIMLSLLHRLPDKTFWHQAALVGAGYLLSPITPSGNSRLSLLLPLYSDMREGLNLKPRGKAATALMAASFSGAMLFSPMLATSKSSNIAAINLLPQQMQDLFLGLYWLVAAGAAAIFLTLLHFLVSLWLCRGEASAPLPKDRIKLQLELLGPMSRSETIASLGFLFFLVGAGTVSWHHIQAGWIAGLVLVGLLLSGVFGKKAFRQSLDWPMIFFLLGIDSVTKVMDYLDITPALGRLMAHSFHFIDGRIELFILATLIVTLLVRIALPVTAGMLVSFIALLPVAQAQGIHPWICLFMTAMFSDIWFFPYQSSVYLQATSQGLQKYYDEPIFMRHNLIMNIGRIAAAYISIPYWRGLGLV